jgi:DNA modification methylase
MADFRIYEGDCIEQMRTIPDASVNCCVTSPPYYGLRDYGTGKWEGGDPNCSHKRDSKHSDKITTGHSNMGGAVGDGIYKDVCPRCGAVRHDRQIGLEQTPEDFIAKLVEVFREVKRVLKDDGTLWVNIGDSYSGSGKGPAGNLGKEHDERNMEDLHSAVVPAGTKPKDLIGIPWMLAFALRADGWYLRQDIIWHKPNPMPESVKDRCTKSHEYIFLLSKSRSYYFDNDAIMEIATGYDGRKDTKMKGSDKYKDGDYLQAGNANSCSRTGRERWTYKNLQEDGQEPNTMHLKRMVGEEYMSPVRNKRSVWSVATKPYKEAHFATYPAELIEPCILAGCPKDGTVLDPFGGSGTTAEVALTNNRNAILCELNPEYIALMRRRLSTIQPNLI